MSPRTLKNLGVALLALAIACVALAFSASNKRLDIQGPSALAVLPDGSAWLSVDEALWHLGADGARLAVVDGRTLAVGGLIGNLVVHPDGRLVASVRDDPTLYFLDASSGKIVQRLVPQWPASLAFHSSRAITYAFHNDGRVAISTGGGHAVAMFDASGRFLGRTQPGLYQFTNGLWWTENSLWTTDTNGVALVELDGTSFAERSRVRLVQQEGRWRYLGMAVASQGKPAPPIDAPPLATLVRFANGMVQGHAVDVFTNGTQKVFTATTVLEPRDIKWRTGELLLVDGASYSVKRYSDQRNALPDFGDAQVRRELASLLAMRGKLQVRYYAGLAAAVVLFILGFAAALRAQSLEKRRALAKAGVDLSQLGTPRLSGWSLAVMGFQHFWLPTLLFGATLLLQFATLLPGAGREVGFAAVGGMIVLSLAALLFFLRGLRRAAADPHAEALFNYSAVHALETDLGFWNMRKPGEVPRETLMFGNPAGGLRWLVLTNQRLLVFVTNLKDRTLAEEYPRRAIAGLRLLEPAEVRWWQRLQPLGGAALRFQFRDGETLQGSTPARQTAQRMADLLRATAFDAPSASQMGRALREQSNARKAEPQAQPALMQALGSLLIPGLGQWMQRRNGTALRMFIAWLVMLVAVAVPVVWTLWAPRAAVASSYVATVAASYLMICALAAMDTWRMRRR